MSVLSSKALKEIAKELVSLHQTPPEDIQVIPNDEDLTTIKAWIRGPDGTPYEGGYFKVRLEIDASYPETPPKGYFMTKIFHPNISLAGEICVNTLKKDWKAELGIKDVLLTIKCLLIAPNPESALNEDAGKLLLEQYDDYAKRARLYTSIQAQSGKSEYLQLGSKENKCTLTTETIEKNSSNTILKPVSNTKRKQDDTQSNSSSIKKKKALRRL